MTVMSWLSDLLYGKNVFRYHVAPSLLLFGLPLGLQGVLTIVQGGSFSMYRALDDLRGDSTSWALILLFYFWAWLSIRVSTKIHLGDETNFGLKPRYADNGFQYFMVTMGVYLLLQAVFPGTSRLVYDKFPKMMGACSVFALIFCVWLLIKGKYWREHEGDVLEPAPVLYEYYRGMELHPRIFGADVKQWTNCRVGLMSWAVLLTAFLIVYLQENGYSSAVFMHFFLQMVYIAKFYWWEDGYFHTIDMMTDRAGFYLCWGCLMFLPGYFCYPASYVITHQPDMSDFCAYAIGGLGLALSFLEYLVDEQKFAFRQTWPKEYKILGKPATFILAEYTNSQGERKGSPLLTSGFWGAARHLNYALEIIISFTISATLGFNHGIITFAYFFLIAPLVLHRILRDDAKCSAKYGKDWVKYKERVKYVLIPGIL